jgi:SAM-dependent methyltransferase
MENYWRNHFDRRAIQYSDSVLKQVGRTVQGREVEEKMIDLIVEDIRHHLDINKSDSVLDLCCGNGLLTDILAEQCEKIVGVDYSASLIAVAKSRHASHAHEYIASDILDLTPDFLCCFNKFFMYDGLQYISAESFSLFLSKLGEDAVGCFRFFVGGIPDIAKLTTYYDTDEKMAYYHAQEANETPHIGKWWGKEELRQIVEKQGLSIKWLSQSDALYTAYYRYDCLIFRGCYDRVC